MKKLFLLFAMFFFANVVNAQVNVTDDITSNTTWSADTVYTLDGLIFVDSTYTLTIEAGTVIKGKLQANITTGDGASALIVRRGGTLIADGTESDPIIFTTELDDVTDPVDMLNTDRELWGGVILLGSATTNQPGDTQIEGIPPSENAKYGGDNDADSSGVLRYVSIRHGGFSISGVPGDEINGLTMGAIGSSTIIEHVEVFANKDDGYEWFGGAVNCKWLVAAFCGDECFDWDQGYHGKGQFWFGIQATDEAGKGMELDGGDDDETGRPLAIPTVSNLTLIGAGYTTFPLPGGDQNPRAIDLRDNSGGHFYSSIITDFAQDGLNIENLASGEDSRTRLDSAQLTIENIYWWNFAAGNDIDSIAKQDFVSAYLTGTGTNYVQDPQLYNISRDRTTSLDPRPIPTSPAVTGAMVPNDPFFTQVVYHGAFDPGVHLWTDGWTALSSVGITDVREDRIAGPQNFKLNQNYPNPFNPSTKISYSLNDGADVKLTVTNVIGQEVAVLLDGFRNAGTYEITFDAIDLPSGIYIYTLNTGASVISKKMTLLK
ncbi:MAG: T9SS type A sorting domain-containing protein [Ignavibacteria bacterium]|jgi:hypothetical protein